jgi:hypothetical protein
MMQMHGLRGHFRTTWCQRPGLAACGILLFMVPGTALAGNGPQHPYGVRNVVTSSTSHGSDAATVTSSASSSSSATSSSAGRFTHDILQQLNQRYYAGDDNASERDATIGQVNVYEDSFHFEGGSRAYLLKDDIFFVGGAARQGHGWKLHISLPYDQSDQNNPKPTDNTYKALSATLNVLGDMKVAHKFVFPGAYDRLLESQVSKDGGKTYESFQKGKFVTVYPRDKDEFQRVCSTLREQMRSGNEFREVVSTQNGSPTMDDHIFIHGDSQVFDGLPIYMRYGAFTRSGNLIRIEGSEKFPGDPQRPQDVPDEVVKLALGEDAEDTDRYPKDYLEVPSKAKGPERKHQHSAFKYVFDHWEIHDNYLRLFRSAPATKDRELTEWKTFSEAVKTEQDLDRPTHVAHAERAEAAPRIDEPDVSVSDILDRNVMKLRTEDINRLVHALIDTGEEGSQQKIRQLVQLNDALNYIRHPHNANSSMIDRSDSVSSSSTSSTSASEQPKAPRSLFKRLFSRKQDKQPIRSDPMEKHLSQNVYAVWSKLSNDVRQFLAEAEGVAEVEAAREEVDEDDIDDGKAAERKQPARRGRK